MSQLEENVFAEYRKDSYSAVEGEQKLDLFTRKNEKVGSDREITDVYLFSEEEGLSLIHIQMCIRDRDDTVQHAGVVVGFGGYAGHVNTGIGRDDYGYMVRAMINCNYSAVDVYKRQVYKSTVFK